MQDYILLITYIAVTAFLGWNILSLLSGRETHLFIFEKIGLSYLLGIGIISAQMFVMSLFNIGFTRFNILIPWVLVLAGTGFFMTLRLISKPVPADMCPISKTVPARDSFLTKPVPTRDNFLKKPVPARDVILICLITLQTLYNFFRALIKPIESYDAVSIYGLKSKMIYVAHGIAPGFFKSLASNFHGAHPDYPLLVPLSETWVYTFLNNFNDLAVKAVFPMLFLSFILVFYAILKRITQNRALSLLFTFGLASVAQFSNYSTIGVADLALGIYFGVSIFYLYLWSIEKKSLFLNISLVSSVLCLWTKNEGLLLCLISLAVLLFYTLLNIKKIKKAQFLQIAAYVFLALLFIGLWGGFKADQGLVNENFNPSMVNAKNLVSGLNKIPAILYGVQRELFGVKKWNLSWILFLFLLVTRFKYVFSRKIKYVTTALFLFGLGYGLMYVFSAVEIRFFVRVTASRFLLHILPVAMFWSALVVKDRMDKVIFIDRDGVINKDPGGRTEYNYVTRWEDFIFLPDSIKALKELNRAGFEIVVISNQAGVNKGYYTGEKLDEINRKMVKEIEKNGAKLKKVYYCVHQDSDNCGCRKPKTGLFRQAEKELGVKADEGYFVGDGKMDVEAANRLGLKSALVLSGKTSKDDVKDWEIKPDHIFNNLLEAAEFVIGDSK